MIKLRAVFENEKRDLWPGQFVRTRLVLYTQKNALLIPFTAIQMTGVGPIAYVTRENMTIERRALKLGVRQDEKVIVLEGLLAGESIVLEGQLNLTDGVQVYVPDKQ